MAEQETKAAISDKNRFGSYVQNKYHKQSCFGNKGEVAIALHLTSYNCFPMEEKTRTLWSCPFPPQLAARKQYVAFRLLLLSPILPAFVFIFHLQSFLPLSHEPPFYYQKQQNRSKGRYFLWQKREDQITTSCLSHKFKLCSIGKIWSHNETRAIGISDHLTNKCHHAWHARSSVTLTRLFSLCEAWHPHTHTHLRTHTSVWNGNLSDTFLTFGDSARLSFEWQFDWRARVSRSFSLIYPFL